MRRRGSDGILVLDKPAGITSRDALNRAQGWFPRGTRIGHTGTLDPLATGVLVLCLGVATRLADYVQRMTKTYRAGIRLDARSDTDDADGTLTPIQMDRLLTRDDLERALTWFVGEFEQVPPAFSAAKINGRRAYDLARGGEEVSLAPRRVRIDRIDVLAYEWPSLEIEVQCGRGTYIRSLARDLGDALGCGGYVTSLRRTRVGPFDVADAVKLEDDRENVSAKVLPVEAALGELPRMTVNCADATRLCHGEPVEVATPAAVAATETAVFDENGRLVGVCSIAGATLRPERIIHPN